MTSPVWKKFDAYVDAVIERIQDHEAELIPPGTSLTILEGDEEPQRIDKFPQIRVIPLIGDGDRISSPHGDEPVHNFETTIIGFYQYRTIPEGIRPVRKYGYTLLELFTGPNQYVQVTLENGDIFGVATIENSQVRVGYRRSGDYVIHAFQVTLNQVGA